MFTESTSNLHTWTSGEQCLDQSGVTMMLLIQDIFFYPGFQLSLALKKLIPLLNSIGLLSQQLA